MDTARDFFHFVTKFFEPIKASATHIYHSALELCPISSIVRKLYYDRCDRITQCPRVVVGTPDRWDRTRSLFCKGDGNSCDWSPCGQFIAARTREMVEIRNHLTLEILTVLQSPSDAHPLIGSPAYSPDGWSLACAFSNGVVIWDIQTGGVVKGLKGHCDIESLVWSLDGKKIAIISNERYSNCCYIKTYDIASSTQLFAERSYTPHLWAYKETFRFVTDSLQESRPEISISEIGTTLTKIESVSPTFRMYLPTVTAFSPSTSRVSISDLGSFRVVDIRESKLLLEGSNDFDYFQFSSDGNLFVASGSSRIRIWKYASGTYTFWKELPVHFVSRLSCDLRFSPTSASILSNRWNIVQVWPLDDSLTPPSLHRPFEYSAISPSGHYFATAHGSTITIIGVHSRAPPWLVDTGAEIEGLVITRNVLLAESSGKVVAWLLTEEGAGNCQSIWTVYGLSHKFSVEDQVGVIRTDDHISPFIYHTGTGDVLDSVHEPQQYSHPFLPFTLFSDCQEYRYLRRDAPWSSVPPEDSWPISNRYIEGEAWIRDPQRRHRLWVPVEWRTPREQEDWHHDITTLFIRIPGQIVIVKF